MTDRAESSSIPGLPLASGSAEALRKIHSTKVNFGSSEHTPVKKKPFFINPFDPKKMHAEITAYHRRWMHTFPRNKVGLAFQIHHAIIHESFEESDSFEHSLRSLAALGDSVNLSGSYERQGGHSKGQEIASSSGGKSFSNAQGSSTPLSIKSGKESSGSASPRNSLTKTGSSGSPGLSRKGKGGTRGGTKPSDSIKLSRKNQTEESEKSLFSLEKQTFQAQPKVAEDFASIRRSGTDWQSLVEPACLPITSDYFPSDSTLHRDYFLYPTKLVVSSYGTANREKA